MKQRCRDARSNFKNAIEVAKGKWTEMLVEKKSYIKINPKLAWDNIKILKDGFKGHHVEKGL